MGRKRKRDGKSGGNGEEVPIRPHNRVRELLLLAPHRNSIFICRECAPFKACWSFVENRAVRLMESVRIACLMSRSGLNRNKEERGGLSAYINRRQLSMLHTPQLATPFLTFRSYPGTSVKSQPHFRNNNGSSNNNIIHFSPHHRKLLTVSPSPLDEDTSKGSLSQKNATRSTRRPPLPAGETPRRGLAFPPRGLTFAPA